MGQGYVIQCDNCEYEETILFGIGPNGYSNINRAFSNLDYHRKKKIKQIINNYPNIESRGTHIIMQCNKCNHIFGRYYLILLEREQKYYETKYACPACRSRDIEIRDDKFDVITAIKENECPKCRKKTLNVISEILWD